MSLIGVRFKPAGRVHYFDSSGIELEAGDRVVAETEAGPREGRVVIPPGRIVLSELRGPLPRILSLAEGVGGVSRPRA